MSRVLIYLAALVSRGMFVCALILAYMYFNLPNVSNLKNVSYQEPLEILTRDGELIESFGKVYRIPIKIEEVPTLMKQAILVTEDQRFYEHPGIDLIGIGRAVRELLSTGEKRQGASTITMQVARNFFLGREKTYFRKLNEVMLALAIERSISKEEILELYLNKIYFGHRAYGIAAAARNYFDKPLSDLTVAEMAMLAGLPKSPSRNNPIDNLSYATSRRNLILSKMLEKQIIPEEIYQESINEPVHLKTEMRVSPLKLAGRYVADLARQTIVNQLGDSVYESGIKVYTTIDGQKQIAASDAMVNGLGTYDVKEGWHDQPRKNNWQLYQTSNRRWKRALQTETVNNSVIAATVVDLLPHSVLIDNVHATSCEYIDISQECWLDNQWCLDNDQVMSTDALKLKQGETIYLKRTGNKKTLTQIPMAQGSLVALNAKTSEIEALIGGYSFGRSHFNRATQAYRQPGSAIKPLLYAAALENGYTMATKVNDAPIVIEDMHGDNDLWRPKNVDRVFKGPIRLRQALIQSRNLVSVRLANEVGLEPLLEYFEHFGLNKSKQPNGLSVSLGAGLVTPLQLAHSFTVFTNQGTLEPVKWINHVVDKHGETLWDEATIRAAEQQMLPLETKAQQQVIKPETAYMIANGLRDVIRYGTGRGAKVLKRDDISGKTGTSNDQIDAWFSGFNGDLVTTVWVGHDEAQSKQLKGMGSKVALPIWVDFMRSALSQKLSPVEAPDTIIRLRINRDTGLPVLDNLENSMFEIFAKDNLPQIPREEKVVDDDVSLRDELF